jgi:SAM-dependent methyltransferase
MLEIARKRCPEATFQQGDMESLPYEPNQFHIVTGFNSFQFASSPINALGEVARVGTPGAQVVIATWGPADKCDAAAYLKAVSSLLPPMPVGTPGPFAMSQPGALEALAREARLHPVESHDVECIWDYKDEPTLLRAMLSSGRSVSAINRVGEARTIQGILTALVPYRTPEGGYRLRNVFRYLIAEL